MAVDTTMVAMQAPWAAPATALQPCVSSRPRFTASFTSGLRYGGSSGLESGCGGARRLPLGLRHSNLAVRKVSREERKWLVAVRASAGKDGFPVSESRVATLRRLLEQPGIYQAPACYDALSASLVEKAGFDFSFMSGFAVSAARLAGPDAGLISFGEMVDQGRMINAAVKFPVIGDADTGYGNALNVKRTVQGYIQAGFAGLLLEDQVSPKACGHTKGRNVVSREEAVMRIRAAVDARREAGSDIVIVARSDARQAVSIEEALWRVQAFADAGADVLFIDALASVGEMRAFCNVAPGVPKMANMLEGGGKTPILSPLELEDIGFKIVVYPLSLVGVSIRAMQDALLALKSGRLPPPSALPSFEAVKDIVGFPKYYEEEARYSTQSSTRRSSYSRMPADASVAPSNEQSTAVVPDLVIPGGESSNAASSSVADVVESLSPRSMRSTFAGMWSRTLRVKITGKDGTVKLDISVPAGFLEGISNTIPAVAGLDLRQILERAQINLGTKLDSGSILADFNDPAGDRIQVTLE
ncbi:hypothetical protein M758_6G089500 [Ceratodon purpureus]|nr:hypothetical protein M758_6G089500 [Ceratodon purpureus]